VGLDTFKSMGSTIKEFPFLLVPLTILGLMGYVILSFIVPLFVNTIITVIYGCWLHKLLTMGGSCG